MSDLSLTVTRHIPAPPDRVFNAWLNPEMMTRFMAGGMGMHVSEARSEARVGGRFFVMMVGEKEIPHAGTYTEITPHTRLAFTWESPYAPPESLVTLTFRPAKGGTDVELTHARFLTESSRDGHQAGWTSILEKLAAEMA